MRYLSVCSGIEAASVAWKPLGWECAGVSEIDKFPRAVLEHRLGAVPVDDEHRWTPGQNFTPLFGDFTKIEAHHVGPIDLLVGGTPCQSFSIAGKRLGLDDPRGNLALEFLALAKRVRAKWILWENVPGVYSSWSGEPRDGWDCSTRRGGEQVHWTETADFIDFLSFFGECGYRGAWRTLDAQYVRTRRFGRAVPQRRRRVFLVGYSGTADIHPRAVLFDRESLRGNPAPRREAGEGIATAARSGAESGRGSVEAAFRWQNEQAGLVEDDCAASLRAKGTTTDERSVGAYVAQSNVGTDFDCDGGLIPDTAWCLQERDSKGPDSDTKQGHLIPVAHSIRAEGFDASEDGTGRGTPIVPIAFPAEMSSTQCASTENLSPALSVKHTTAIAFSSKDHGADAMQECSPTLRAGGHSESHANAGVPPAVAFAQNTRDEVRIQGDGHISGALGAEPGMKQQTYLAAAWGVRRLTPTECERLQGFPDGWTAIPWGKKTPEDCPDGPRYKALGNSMAVNVMCWIGERIHAVAQLEAEAR